MTLPTTATITDPPEPSGRACVSLQGPDDFVVLYLTPQGLAALATALMHYAVQAQDPVRTCGPITAVGTSEPVPVEGW